MGCASSTSGQNPSAKGEDIDIVTRRKTFDKKSGVPVEQEIGKEKKEDDFFEVMEAGQGEQFMAVRPYEGAIFEPTNHAEPNPSPPDVNYKLEYCYGYKSDNVRNNLFLTNDGQYVFMSAALGIVHNPHNNTQKFFGGGKVENSAKNVANDANCHTDDILAIKYNSKTNQVVSGQVGASPVAFVWDASSQKLQSRMKLPKGSRGITAVAISPDGKRVACVDLNDQHRVYCFDAANGSLLFQDNGDTSKIFDVAFTQEEGKYNFTTAGSKHIKFWDPVAQLGEKGLYGQGGLMNSFAVVDRDGAGNSFTGATTGEVYIWAGRDCIGTYKVHDGGFISAMKFCNGKLFTGGKDGKVCISDPMSKTVSKQFATGSLVRGLDFNDNICIAGLKNGSIVEINLGSGQVTAKFESHCDGELWGLTGTDNDHAVTSCDDNQIKCWNLNTKKCEATGIICSEQRKAKRGGASSLTDVADSQCARAVAFNPANGHIAVGHNDGTLTIRASQSKLNEIIATKNDTKEWIEAMKYSPDGTKLAVGSHENFIYIYDVANNYNLLATLKGHNSFIVSVDWSADGSYIRSVCGAHELLFFTTADWKQDPSGGSNTVGLDWHTNTAKYGWLVAGIFPSGVDGTHINGVDFSKDGTLIATGDDYGLVNVFRNPCRPGHNPISLRGHSEHVVKAIFHNNDKWLLSAGGYDQCVLQFTKN